MYDYCVIGGGIVGVATAVRILAERPGAALVLLEKGDALGRQQTGHNSGVIHSGIYYQPGSLKAELCRRGAAATKEFAAEHGIPFEECGKLLVATSPIEMERMTALYERSKHNQLDVEVVDRAELARREPAVAGLGALFVPSTGIVDYRGITDRLAEQVTAAGGQIALHSEVTAIAETGDRVEVSGPTGSWQAKQLVVCVGCRPIG
ncbi:FAD-dependent oxidoreductase, partial [Aldersonia kunmingensis]|uniref:FAD-dependent oxidoreductase n=1 Tax=Aldersonia kunmingensis TaxID=408066 RepID=UPI000B1EC1A0